MTYTSKVKNKELLPNGTVKVNVIFTNGTKTVEDFCIPQDRQGFDYWLVSKLTSLNLTENVDVEFPDDGVVEPPVTPEPVPLTAEEIARAAWLDNYYRLVRAKNNLVDTGVVPPNNVRYTNLQQLVRDGLTANPSYFDFI